MKLSTKGRYGLRLMIDLAIRYQKGPTMLKDISARQGISEKYLWQLISPLMVAGLIVSKRGAHGGYDLARDPSEIKAFDVITVLEGELDLVDCVSDNLACERIEGCITRDLWSEVSQKIKEVLTSYTLKDMADRYFQKTGNLIYII